MVDITVKEEEGKQAITMYDVCLMHSRADRALRVVVSKQLEQFNVTMMEWLLMGAVRSGPKEGMTMSGVAAMLDVTLPQVTALTANLTKSKLLKQKISRQDRRSRRLVCSTAGMRLLGEIEDAVNISMREWLNKLPAHQLNVYYETIKFLASHKLKDDTIE